MKETEKQGPDSMYDWAGTISFSIVIIVLIFMFVVRINGVEQYSMRPTLENSDRVLVQSLFYTPARGDIVILRKESFMNEPLVKRIIATEGQSVDIDFSTGDVFVDGKKLDEPYLDEPTYRNDGTRFPLTVPEGHVFVMGDNRNHSSDSRDPALGTVDSRMIIGRVFFRLYPFNKIGYIGSHDYETGKK